MAFTTDPQRASFHTLFGDGQYAVERSIWLRNVMLGIPVSPLDYAEAFNDYGDTVRYGVASVREFALIPKSWSPRTWSDVAMIPQQVIWYALLLCCLPGVAMGMRRDALFTSVLLGNVLVAVAVIAPTSGNVGTLIRHRDMIVPFLVWIGVLGAIATPNGCANLVRKEGK